MEDLPREPVPGREHGEKGGGLKIPGDEVGRVVDLHVVRVLLSRVFEYPEPCAELTTLAEIVMMAPKYVLIYFRGLVVGHLSHSLNLCSFLLVQT